MTGPMIGVTIGVGYPYAKLATLAATCVEEHTGLKCHVLDHTHFSRSGLRHPAALRLALFDYFDHSDVLYFDADWICLNSWRPSVFAGRSNLVACRDFTLDIHYPKQDYDFSSPEFIGRPGSAFSCQEQGVQRADYCAKIIAFTNVTRSCSNWLNSGLLILNRQSHRRWLDRALALYCSTIGHHEEYFEQPALLAALDDCGVQIDFLPRKFNVLATRIRKWPSIVTGLHVKLKHHLEFAMAVNGDTISTPDQAKDYFVENETTQS